MKSRWPLSVIFTLARMNQRGAIYAIGTPANYVGRPGYYGLTRQAKFPSLHCFHASMIFTALIDRRPMIAAITAPTRFHADAQLLFQPPSTAAK